jgi:hypothetical protein
MESREKGRPGKEGSEKQKTKRRAKNTGRIRCRLIKNLVARFILQEKTLRALFHIASINSKSRSSVNENPIGKPSALFSEAPGSHFLIDREASFY